MTALTCSSVTILTLCDDTHAGHALGFTGPSAATRVGKSWNFMRDTVENVAGIGIYDADGMPSFEAGPSKLVQSEHQRAQKNGFSLALAAESAAIAEAALASTKSVFAMLPRALGVLVRPSASPGEASSTTRQTGQRNEDPDGAATAAAQPHNETPAGSTVAFAAASSTADAEQDFAFISAPKTCRRPWAAFSVALVHIFASGALLLYIGCAFAPRLVSKACCLALPADRRATSGGEYASDADAMSIPTSTTAALASVLDASDPEQVEMMKERVILLDAFDNVVGSGTKKKTHLNALIDGPSGLLHRAFSVFMFNQEGKLLLQKRADEKVTFPKYWANTCCSHPLYVANELDGVDGVRNAARRKLLQELGIPASQVPKSCLHFLTRVHYRAPSDALWGELHFFCLLQFFCLLIYSFVSHPTGEHEIDYVMIALPPGKITVAPNANEVGDVRWVDPAGLTDLLNDDGELVSPWFRAIEGDAPMLHRWWDVVRAVDGAKKSLPQLQATRGDALELLAEKKRIHRDVTIMDVVAKGKELAELSQASASAAPVDGAAAADKSAASAATTEGNDASKKQGAYGKVKVHKAESTMVALLKRPRELCAAIALKSAVKRIAKEAEATPLAAHDGGASAEDIEWACGVLGQVSRSFSTVIAQLPVELRLSVTMFYLALRALDTVEDDMDLERFAPYVKASDAVALASAAADATPASTRATALLNAKVALLTSFYERLVPAPANAGPASQRRAITGVGEGAERELVERFERCANIVAALPASHAVVIADVTKRMGEGMAQYIDRDLTNGTDDVADYDRYCTIVAGFVGEGLTKVSFLFTVTFYANHAHNLTRSP